MSSPPRCLSMSVCFSGFVFLSTPTVDCETLSPGEVKNKELAVAGSSPDVSGRRSGGFSQREGQVSALRSSVRLMWSGLGSILTGGGHASNNR